MRTILLSLLTISIASLSFNSCKDKQNRKSQKALTKTDTVFIRENLPPRNEYMVLSTLYQQKAAEYRALSYQTFNLAALMLDNDLADKRVDKHRVVIVDIDETVLDNSPFLGKSILENSSYPKYWNEWCSLAKA